MADAAAILAKMQKADEAQAVFKEALQAAGEIADSLSQAYSYRHLSEKLNKAGKKAAARNVLEIAEQSADKVGDQSMELHVMEKIYAARRTIQSCINCLKSTCQCRASRWTVNRLDAKPSGRSAALARRSRQTKKGIVGRNTLLLANSDRRW